MRRRVFFAVFLFQWPFLFDERLSLWESWRGAPERARTLTARRPHRDTIALTKNLPIAVSAVCLHGLALSVTFGDTSPRGRGFSASASLSCNQTVAFFTLFSKIKGKLKNVLLKKWRICVTLHPSCNGIFGDSGVFSPVFFGSGERRQSDYHAFFLLFCPFWLFFRPFSLVARGKVW